MAYITNIPGPNDLFSQSQPQILGNFTAIKDLVDVNHVDFDDATNFGKHKFVSLVSQVAAPTLNNTADVIAYGFSTGITGKNEMFISKVNQVTVTQINATGSTLSNTSAPSNNSSGWTYLPSGILMKWGNGNADGLTTTNFPVGATIPVFNQVFSIQVTTAYGNAADGDGFCRLQNFNTTQFNVYGSDRTSVANKSVNFQYLAIGY